ncbi:hypothetical protein CHS0354_036780 [Potamilus streckersoni]|uniref:Uncharacterized protein n=1 Tax=Potamilus streckersoni TaxID=2493646 RepID=A0AAE0S5L2_9BIVA|nr:hypothetical protein CHS0354_036780 [Potamilus streckersoni]
MNPTNAPQTIHSDSIFPRRDAQVNNNSSSNASRHSDNIQDMTPVKPGQDIGPLKYERNRLATFENWPPTAEVDPVVLAKSGFRYTRNGDRVQCVFCKVILRNWEQGDVVHIEHRNHSPLCPFLNGLNVGNVPIPQEQRVTPRIRPAVRGGHLPANVVESMSDLETLGVNTVRPKHPQYAIESLRVASFTNWPPHKQQTPDQLAKAGFFYAGISDNVKCFFCDGGLRNFDARDDPWVEHAKYFPTCRYLLQCKGQGFINTRINHEREPTLGDLLAREEQRQIAVNEVDEREVRARLDLTFVKAVLEMGFSRDLIKRVIRKQLEAGGDFSSATTLLEAAFAEQAQEEQFQNTSGSQTQVKDTIQHATANQSDSRSNGEAHYVFMTQELEANALENEETVTPEQGISPSLLLCLLLPFRMLPFNSNWDWDQVLHA